MNPEILPVDSPIRSNIRSGIALPSFSQCIEELIANSLDAGATNVTINFNLKSFSIKVSDNGCGFNERNLTRAGVRYRTSKCHTKNDLQWNLKFYGFRGEALASIAEVSSSLKIKSTLSESKETICKTITKGKCFGINRLQSRGDVPNETSVTVHGLYENLPVRRQAINEVLETDSIKNRVQRISIVHPRVSFAVFDDAKPEGDPYFFAPQKSTLLRFLDIFNHCQAEKDFKRIQCKSSEKRIRIEGAICKLPHETKSLQFVYVNNRTVLKTKIHKEVNKCVKLADIFRGDELSKDVNNTKRKCGVYFFNIECPCSKYDICLEPDKTILEFRNWKEILDFVKSSVNSVLKKMSQFPQSYRTVTSPMYDSEPNCKQPLLDLSGSKYKMEYGTDGVTIVSKRAEFLCKDLKVKNPTIEGVEAGRSELSTRENKEINYEQNEMLDTIKHQRSSPIHEGTDDDALKLTSSRKNSAKASLGTAVDVRYSSSNDAKRLRTAEYCPDAPPKLDFLCRKYKEFQPRTKEIRRSGISALSRQVGSKKRKDGRKKTNVPSERSAVFDRLKTNEISSASLPIVTFPVKFDESIFSSLKVIGQIDRKFIACHVQKTSQLGGNDRTKVKEMIVLLDQHAVHERIRLEELEREAYDAEKQIKSLPLEKPLSIPIGKEATRKLELWKEKFLRFGLKYNFSSNKEMHHSISVTSLPALFAHKASKLNNREARESALEMLVMDLIKEQLEILADTFGGCSTVPKSIFNILCSQACHGAIKFGNKLDNDQCEKLVESLSHCKLPFQCAHGRPSITPLSLPTNVREEKRPNIQKLRHMFKI